MSDISVDGAAVRSAATAVTSRSTRITGAIVPGGIPERKGKAVAAFRIGSPNTARGAGMPVSECR